MEAYFKSNKYSLLIYFLAMSKAIESFVEGNIIGAIVVSILIALTVFYVELHN